MLPRGIGQAYSKQTQITGRTGSLGVYIAIACSLIVSRPAAAAARAIPDLLATIFSAYCSGIRVDFHPPACVIKCPALRDPARRPPWWNAH